MNIKRSKWNKKCFWKILDQKEECFLDGNWPYVSLLFVVLLLSIISFSRSHKLMSYDTVVLKCANLFHGSFAEKGQIQIASILWIQSTS